MPVRPGGVVALVRALVAGVGEDVSFLPMQQRIADCHITDVGSGTDDGVHQAGVPVGTDVRLHAYEIVRGAVRFERAVSYAGQEMLNPIGVNCLRFMPRRGNRVWGARTISSDPEWKYVNVRRYLNYVEASIDRGTQWAVFEPDDDRLWASVRAAVSDFLYTAWRNGALLESKPEEAFFVACERTTMTQNALDSGRMICLIGMAVLKPAEFVILRIGQKTAEAKYCAGS